MLSCNVHTIIRPRQFRWNLPTLLMLSMFHRLTIMDPSDRLSVLWAVKQIDESMIVPYDSQHCQQSTKGIQAALSKWSRVLVFVNGLPLYQKLWVSESRWQRINVTFSTDWSEKDLCFLDWYLAQTDTKLTRKSPVCFPHQNVNGLLKKTLSVIFWFGARVYRGSNIAKTRQCCSCRCCAASSQRSWRIARTHTENKHTKVRTVWLYKHITN